MTTINTLLLTLCIKILYENTHYTWSYAFMLASVLSATDGFGAAGLVKECGLSNKF